MPTTDDRWAELREQVHTQLNGGIALIPNDTIRDLLAERDALAAKVDRLRAVLGQCDVAIDTAAIHGLYTMLPPAYRDSWAATHRTVRDELQRPTANPDPTVSDG